MPDLQSDLEALRDAIRRTRRGVLVSLATCALVILASGMDGPEPPPDPALTLWAVGLALLGILLRQAGTSPRMQPRTAFYMALGGLLCCAGLGLLGVWIAWVRDAPQTALIYTLAGAIFTLRPPPTPQPRG